MKFGAVSFTSLVSLTAPAFHVVAQEFSRQEKRISDFQLASLWQDVPGVTEGMVDVAEAVCRPELDISLNECDAAFASAPDDPETVEFHPFCRQLSHDEFMECVKSELRSDGD